MYDLTNYTFINNLIQYRKSRGFTQQDLGQKIGKSKATISKYEQGEIIPDILTILEICNTLDISLSQLFPINNTITSSTSRNPFNSNKLFLYYYTENILITSILEIIEENDKSYVKLYNGVKNTVNYAKNTAYYYEGFLACDKTVGYINLCNSISQNTLLEKLQISFNIPWSNSFNITNFFIMGLTPNSIPVIKKGIMSINPIDNFSALDDDLKICNNDLIEIQKNNSWILSKNNYDHFFFET